MPSLTAPLPTFQDGQIIYLPYEATRLYAETIQIIPSRQLCWARPLALIQLPDQPDEIDVNLYKPLILHDLRQSSDLLLPLSLFHIALDLDAIPVITN
ncbi:MAG: hypothetical protein HC781_00555 [Leptolyngbyaceae cyanobacterium CSU_1_4]|nr:hypothetical protein [Leptolyngbyaceae cyanobacterium CSU_1_4]